MDMHALLVSAWVSSHSPKICKLVDFSKLPVGMNVNNFSMCLKGKMNQFVGPKTGGPFLSNTVCWTQHTTEGKFIVCAF